MIAKHTREQWMLAEILSGTITAMNAPFCVGPGETSEAINVDPDYIDNVASLVAEKCSVTALEDVILVLERAIKIRQFKVPAGRQ